MYRTLLIALWLDKACWAMRNWLSRNAQSFLYERDQGNLLHNGYARIALPTHKTSS